MGLILLGFFAASMRNKGLDDFIRPDMR